MTRHSDSPNEDDNDSESVHDTGEDFEDVLYCIHELQLKHERLLLDIYKLMERQVEIAERYQEQVGVPIEQIINSVRMIVRVLTWGTAAILTLMGLQQAWDWLMKNRPPH